LRDLHSFPTRRSSDLSVGSGDNTMIGGLIITGHDNKKVIVRAIGPSLAGSGISNALSDPVLELRNSSGALIVSNDDWRSNQAERSEEHTSELQSLTNI